MYHFQVTFHDGKEFFFWANDEGEAVAMAFHKHKGVVYSCVQVAKKVALPGVFDAA